MRNWGLLQKDTRNAVPLKAIGVHVDVKGFVADVISTLTYHNDGSDPIEALFTFPMDDDSAVYRFEAEFAKKKIVAEIQEKKQASQTYEAAVEAGHSAFLLEEDDDAGDIFNCRVGNIPPKTDVMVTFSYVIELKMETDRGVKFTLPSVLNPRYYPEVGEKPPGAEKHTEHLTHICTSGSKYSFTFESILDSEYVVKEVKGAKDNYKVDFLDQDHKKCQVILAESFQFDHDIEMEIYYNDILQPKLYFEKGNPDGDGILKEDVLMLNFSPEIDTSQFTGRGEYVFIVDRSGSMRNGRIKSASETLLLFLKSLPVDCYFNIISFGSDHSALFSGGSVKYDKSSLTRACELQKTMAADMGGTEILRPLKWVYDKKPISGFPRQLFLLTDGEVGNTSEVISLVKKHADTTRVFAFGIGEGASTSLIKGVARVGRGKAEFVKGKERLESKVMRVLQCAMQPALLDVELEWQIGDAGLLQFPEKLPPIFAGERLIIYGLISPLQSGTMQSHGQVRIKGKLLNDEVTCTAEFSLENVNPGSSAPIHRLAAKKQIKQFEDSSDEDVQNNLTRSQSVILVSVAANIMSKFTSFVGVDKNTNEELPLEPSPQVQYQEHMFTQSLGCNLSSYDLCVAKAVKLGRSRMKLPSPVRAVRSFFKQKKRKNSKVLCSTPPGPSWTDHSFSATAIHPFGDQVADVPFADEEGEHEHENMPSGKRTTTTKGDYTKLVDLQEFDGSWLLTKKLAAILGKPEQDLRVKTVVKDERIWATALAIAWLELNFPQQRVEWSMLVSKAKTWLGGKELEGKTIEDLLQEATKVIKT